MAWALGAGLPPAHSHGQPQLFSGVPDLGSSAREGDVSINLSHCTEFVLVHWFEICFLIVLGFVSSFAITSKASLEHLLLFLLIL